VREQAVPLSTPVGVPQGREREAIAAPAAALSEDEYSLLERYMARRQALDPARRSAITASLAERFRPRAPDLAGADAAVLVQLFAREQAARARGQAVRTETGAAREQHAIVARGSPRWQEFAAMLASAQTRGLAAMSESEVEEFVARYRELSGDLARLQTAVGGRDATSLFYLNRLVAGGHNLLYRDRRVNWRSAWDYMTITVPREIRRSGPVIALAAALLFAPAVIAYVSVVRHPEIIPQIVPAGMIDRANQGVKCRTTLSWPRRHLRGASPPGFSRSSSSL
jgi:hypothetical protein